MELSEKEKIAQWRWARGSAQAKEVKRLEKEFYDKVDGVKRMALKAK